VTGGPPHRRTRHGELGFAERPGLALRTGGQEFRAELCQSEIHNLSLAIAGQKYVRRLDVAMYDSFRVCGLQSGGGEKRE
jgi:hypothetical protein